MAQPEFADHTDAQLETLRDDLARKQSRTLKRVIYLMVAFAVVSVAVGNLAPPQVLMVGPPVFLVVAFAMLALSFRVGARRVAIVRELESRGVDRSAVISPVTGKPHPGAAVPVANEIDAAALRRLRVPGIGAAVSAVLLLSLVAAIIITEAPDGSWLFTATFILFAPLGVFIVWAVLVLVSVGTIKR